MASRHSTRRPSHRQSSQDEVPQSPSRGHSHRSYTRTSDQNHALATDAAVIGGPRPLRSPSDKRRDGRSHKRSQSGTSGTPAGVVTGTVGGGYGPYTYRPEQGVYTSGRFSHSPSETSVASVPVTRERAPIPPQAPPPVQLFRTQPPPTKPVPVLPPPQPIYDEKDYLHDPDPREVNAPFYPFSSRGWMNVGGILIIIAGLLVLFMGYPIIDYVQHQTPKLTGFNVGGINSSGQIPEFVNFPGLIDRDTPDSALTRKGSDGKTYDLVFSDEFNVDGRTFYPGDDPFWEAADLHYWPTNNEEWYDPSAVTTENGKLVITMQQKRSHDLNFESGMLTSWNKLCFTTGYIEVSVSMPNPARVPGLWPGAWTLGNLGRAGYGATNQGMWPYSYDTCDSGTFYHQQTRDGQPAAASTLSGQPGQRLSACTCPGSDHPGPRVNVGRGVPEIDILETQVDLDLFQGEVSQSFQIAPYNIGYKYDKSEPATTIYNSSITKLNSYPGGPLQQAISGLTLIEDRVYGGGDDAFAPYAVEYWSDPNRRDDGYILWYSDGKPTWKVTAKAIGPDSEAQIDRRLISEEPMYLILNLGMGTSFQKPDFRHLSFPTKMYVDYVRIYQRRGIKDGLTCNPPNRPTAGYIDRHMTAYTNPNLTTWDMANFTFPRNRLYDGC